jgi:hypothetical protein
MLLLRERLGAGYVRPMFVLAIVGFAACGETMDNDLPLEEAQLIELMSAIERVDTWDKVDGWPVSAETDHPSGGFARDRWNTLAYDTIEAQAGGDMPLGTIVRKITSQDEAGLEVDGVTTMMKVEDGWFWAAFDDNGDTQNYGSAAKSCC